MVENPKYWSDKWLRVSELNVKEVMESRGKRKVTVTHLLAVFPWARCLSKGLLEDRLHELGLRW